MKVKFIYHAALSMVLAMGLVSCDPKSDDTGTETESADIDVTAENIISWTNYMKIVAQLLQDDATLLNNEWVSSYADGFKNHSLSAYTSASSCIEQIIDGCMDIASEVGEAKIGDPLDLYNSGKKTQALYAVESWYSWHSIDDYSNNILSIRNAYYGSRDGKVSEVSMSGLVSVTNKDLDEKVKKDIQNAYDAIQSIPAPFRNHINASEVGDAQDACANLYSTLNSLKSVILDIDDSKLEPVVSAFVDNVVLPTYADLVKKNTALNNAVKELATNPCTENFKKCATAWLNAREPWETSEAFLFGPVADNGLDPNMDSWPLDQDGIVNILNSQKFESLEWDGEYDEENADIEKSQNLRGFHTLEFLIFKDGKARNFD